MDLFSGFEHREIELDRPATAMSDAKIERVNAIDLDEAMRRFAEAYTERSELRDRILVNRLQGLFKENSMNLVTEAQKDNPNAVHVLIGQHLSFVLVKVALENGLDLMDFTSYLISHNPQEAKPGSQFYLENSSKLDAFESALREECSHKDDPRYGLIWKYDSDVPNSADTAAKEAFSIFFCRSAARELDEVEFSVFTARVEQYVEKIRAQISKVHE